MASSFLSRVGGAVKSGLAVLGAATAAGLYIEYKKAFPTENKDEQKKRVLVVPFHRMQIVERKSPVFGESFAGVMDENEEKEIKIELRELVDLLHSAASDPSISAVYGVFGHGGTGILQSGWAQLEEVRNALQVIKEAHRRHAEPNLTHETQVIPRVQSKPLYAYTDSFVSFADPSNKEYYVASVFTDIHMQNKGELNLLGLLTPQYFIRDLLEKYKIQVHVFKHGNFKNATNFFTHRYMNKFHRENVASVHESINQGVCEDIMHSRSKALPTSWLTNGLWKRIHDSGTFSAEAAWKAGLVDFLPRRDPLQDLIASKSVPEIADKWNPNEADFIDFTEIDAEKSVSLEQYARQVKIKKNAAQLREQWKKYASSFFDSPSGKSVMGAFGFKAMTEEKKPKDRIALLQVVGGIDDKMAREVVRSIRKISPETKCVVMRVASRGGAIVPCETILQELKGLDLPIVVSFGDVSASGGYYVASGADRIFSSRKTITGSIGVFGVRMDLTGLANKYGINVDHVASGDLSATYSSLHPMSRKMKENMAGQIDRYYTDFKTTVADGRDMAVEEVENIAQGRVWTGDQAKNVGLVDELGGLYRAIVYARRTFTSNDVDTDDDIIVIPKKRSFFERLKEAQDSREAAQIATYYYRWYVGQNAEPEPGSVDSLVEAMVRSPGGVPGSLSGVFMAADEDTAIRCLLDNSNKSRNTVLPESFWDCGY